MKTLLLVALSLVGSGVAFAQADTLAYCMDRNQVGVGGYDPVSYFNEANPKLGSEKFTSTFEGVVYRFASARNKKLFEATPEKYLPQFGGWCSMTMALGRATRPAYDNFLITDGKLFLFERTLSVNGRELWLKKPQENETTARRNYQQHRKGGKGK